MTRNPSAPENIPSEPWMEALYALLDGADPGTLCINELPGEYQNLILRVAKSGADPELRRKAYAAALDQDELSKEDAKRFLDYRLARVAASGSVERVRGTATVPTVRGTSTQNQSNDRDRNRSWAQARLEPRPELASKALYGWAGRLVGTIGPQSEADPAAILINALVAFGNVVGRGPHFMVGADVHPLVLFACVVGTTSKSRKGSSLSYVRRLLRDVDRDWESKRILSGLSSGEGLINAVRDPEEDDSRIADKRLLIVEQEFAATLRIMGRDGNTLSPILRQAWDGGNLRTITKNSPLSATQAHVSILAHVTSPELRLHLSHTEIGGGFANRFLWIHSRRSRLLPDGGFVREEVLTELGEQLQASVELARQKGELKRDAQASQLWHQAYRALSEGRPGLLGAVTSRAEAQVMRLACIYALLEHEALIRQEHLEAALALWSYCEASARYIFGESLGDPVADQILATLRAEYPSGLTQTSISDGFNRNRSARELERALRTLQDAELVRSQIEAGTGGRNAVRWFAVTDESTN